jgi:broad specificity phosphatase PhoE
VTGLPRDPPLAAFGEVCRLEILLTSAGPSPERPGASKRNRGLLSLAARGPAADGDLVFAVLCIYFCARLLLARERSWYLDRCIQTATPIAKALGLPIYIDHGEYLFLCIRVLFALRRLRAGLSEWYSPVEPGTGLHPRPAPASELKSFFPAVDANAWSSIYYPSRKGENPEELHARAVDFMRAFVPEAARRFPDARRVLLCSHAATVITLARALLGDPALPFRAGCCSLTHVIRRAGAEDVVGGWEAVLVGSGAHLKEGVQRDWGLEDIHIADGKVRGLVWKCAHAKPTVGDQ